MAQGAAAGVIRIDAQDEDTVLSNLLNEAMSYISGALPALSSRHQARSKHVLPSRLSKHVHPALHWP